MRRGKILRVNACVYRLLLAWILAAFAPYAMTGVSFVDERFYSGKSLAVMAVLTLALWLALLWIEEDQIVSTLKDELEHANMDALAWRRAQKRTL